MSEPSNAETNPQDRDHQDLIDFILGQSIDPAAVERRLQNDQAFASLHRDLKNAFAALDLLPEPQAPADLAARTMRRIAQHQQTNALLVSQELNRRTRVRPTFAMRDMIGAAAAIVLLAVVFVPSMRQAREQSQIDLCASQMGQIGAGLQGYANDHQGRLPVTVASQSPWLTVGNRPAASTSATLFQLVPQRYAPAGAFQCPAVSGGDSFVVQSNMTDFPSPKHISYSYQHALAQSNLSRMHPALAPVCSQMAILADNTPLFPQGRFEPGRMNLLVSDNHRRTGQNVLYLDMHVSWSAVSDAGVAGDNIYLIKGVSSYRGDEAPTDPTDSFLLPAYTAGR